MLFKVVQMTKCQVCNDDCLVDICEMCNRKISVDMASQLRKEVDEIIKQKAAGLLAKPSLDIILW